MADAVMSQTCASPAVVELEVAVRRFMAAMQARASLLSDGGSAGATGTSTGAAPDVMETVAAVSASIQQLAARGCLPGHRDLGALLGADGAGAKTSLSAALDRAAAFLATPCIPQTARWQASVQRGGRTTFGLDQESLPAYHLFTRLLAVSSCHHHVALPHIVEVGSSELASPGGAAVDKLRQAMGRSRLSAALEGRFTWLDPLGARAAGVPGGVTSMGASGAGSAVADEATAAGATCWWHGFDLPFWRAAVASYNAAAGPPPAAQRRPRGKKRGGAVGPVEMLDTVGALYPAQTIASVLATGVVAGLSAAARALQAQDKATAGAAADSLDAVGTAASAFVAALLHQTLGVPAVTTAVDIKSTGARFAWAPGCGNMAALVFAAHATPAHGVALLGGSGAGEGESEGAEVVAAVQQALAWADTCGYPRLGHSDVPAAFATARARFNGLLREAGGGTALCLVRAVAPALDASRVRSDGVNVNDADAAAVTAWDADTRVAGKQACAEWQRAVGGVGTGMLILLRSSARQGKSTLIKRLKEELTAAGVKRNEVAVVSRDDWIAKEAWVSLAAATKLKGPDRELLADMCALAKTAGLPEYPTPITLPGDM